MAGTPSCLTAFRSDKNREAAMREADNYVKKNTQRVRAPDRRKMALRLPVTLVLYE